MPSAVSSRNDAQPRNWWSISSSKNISSSGVKDLSRTFSSSFSASEKHNPSPKSSSSLKFNNFASAIGFKSKKVPSLAIQDPPIRPVISTPPDTVRGQTTQYTNRPPSKSVSSTIQSWDDSIGPQTPSDAQRDTAVAYRQSLLTLSDTDPFAARAISVSNFPHDPNRLSVYSRSSAPDSKQTEAGMPFNRSSYSSSSSQSHHDSALKPNPKGPSDKKLTTKRSHGSLRKDVFFADSEVSTTTARRPAASINKSESSTTLTDKHRLSQPDPTPVYRPPMRARGLTEGGTSRSVPLIKKPTAYRPSTSPQVAHSRDSPTFAPPSPRVVVRQPSSSRVGMPTSAPPKHGLPLPPFRDREVQDDDSEIITFDMLGTSSSSSVSFASVSSTDLLAQQSLNPRVVERIKFPDRSLFTSNRSVRSEKLRERDESSRYGNVSTTTSPSSSPRTLKKALSHQTLTKRTPISTATSITPPESPEKVPRKQRSFHHARIPIPPLPNLSLYHTPSSNADNSQPVVDQRRGSTSGSTPGRKRLFSGSSLRRPSTSQCVPNEDDKRSLFSLPAENDLPQASIHSGTPKSPSSPGSPQSSSFWEETQLETPSSPTGTWQDYTPQHIMSPAEMLKVEASVLQGEVYVRPRGYSLASMSTTTSEFADEYSFSDLGLPSAMHTFPDLPFHSTSMLTRGQTAPRTSSRPSTSQATMTIPPPSPSQLVFFSPSSSPETGFVSLPAPPRPRPRTATTPAVSYGHRTSTASITPLSPPPRRGLRPKFVPEQILKRRSIMRKPSFLEIDDEMERVPVRVLTPKDSFLDLHRESFDTVQSIDE